jgi:hypothetical protein
MYRLGPVVLRHEPRDRLGYGTSTCLAAEWSPLVEQQTGRRGAEPCTSPGAYSGLLGGWLDCSAGRLGERERVDRTEVEVCVCDVCE